VTNTIGLSEAPRALTAMGNRPGAGVTVITVP
jgi:hypothetical protein